MIEVARHKSLIYWLDYFVFQLWERERLAEVQSIKLDIPIWSFHGCFHIASAAFFQQS